jgi:hypothetical protein
VTTYPDIQAALDQITAQPASSAYVARSQTVNPGVSNPKVTQEVADPNRTASKWRTMFTAGSFNGHADPAMFTGWNVGVSQDVGEPSLSMGFEADYWDTVATRTMEWYLGVVRADGSGPQFRPFAFTASRDSNADLSASVQIDIGDNSNSSTRSQFRVRAGAATPLIISPTAASFSVPMIILGELDVGRSDYGGIAQLSLSSATGFDPRLSYVVNGAEFFRMTSGAGGNGFYFYAPGLAKFPLLFNMVYGAGAGSAVFDSALQIAGNIGFYGTTPVAKPTVVGAKGLNAALASLLTALASQGLVTDSSTT